MVGLLGLGSWSEPEPFLSLGSDGGWILGFLAEVGGLGLEDKGWFFLLLGSFCLGWPGLLPLRLLRRRSMSQPRSRWDDV